MPRKQLMQLILTSVLVGVVVLIQQWAQNRNRTAQAPPTTTRQTGPASPAPGVQKAANGGDVVPGGRAGIGFRSRGALDEHFQKHGAEFGRITREQYLQRAQALRDAPAGGAVLEAKRADGVITRFSTATGEFLAFNPDYTIRTFFKPNDGRAYFRRQASRPADDEP